MSLSKIDGKVCYAKFSEGTLEPVLNSLKVLKEEGVEAVRNREFHIYPISKVEEGIELLTGVKAGKKTARGYPAGTVFNLVEKKIRYLYSRSKALRPEEEKKAVTKKK